MKIEQLYLSKTETKTGLSIPVFTSGRTLESKYNPERESENLLNTIDREYNFFIVFGLGSGYFVSLLVEKYPAAKIIVIENTQQDFLFLNEFQNVNKIRQNPNIIFSDVISFKNNLVKNYIPALHGDIKIIERISWKNENIAIMPFIIQEMNSALKLVSADYSVQSHFGKIWQHNILSNLKYLDSNNINITIETTKKTAVIVAAGPTLDEKIDYIKTNQDNLFIISTDTAFTSLLKQNIIPEIVVSIDGQHVSQEHFSEDNNLFDNTIFALDLCCNPAIAQKAKKVFFFGSGHPLSNEVVNKYNLPVLYSGSGTVTITALDLATKLGFSDIQVIAADFSYRNGKPYAKGTYLDCIYGRQENRLTTSEKLFTKLMYRTELLKKEEDIFTTDVLESYRKSFEEYLSQNDFNFEYKNDLYFITKCSSTSISGKIIKYSFDMKSFFIELGKEFKNGNTTFLLPYIAYLRNKTNTQNLKELENLAYSYFVSYNYFI